MSDEAEQPTSPNGSNLLTSVLDQLACPACYGGLRLERESLLCNGCGRVYAVTDGIPVLIPDRIDSTSGE
jgi:uncharacterized protein YbaR (Trm112 family)